MADGAAYGASHAAIATPLSVDEVKAVAARYGLLAKVCMRGGLFGVIEVWIEDRFMLEVLTRRCKRNISSYRPANWERMLAAGPPGRAAAA